MIMHWLLNIAILVVNEIFYEYFIDIYFLEISPTPTYRTMIIQCYLLKRTPSEVVPKLAD